MQHKFTWRIPASIRSNVVPFLVALLAGLFVLGIDHIIR